MFTDEQMNRAPDGDRVQFPLSGDSALKHNDVCCGYGTVALSKHSALVNEEAAAKLYSCVAKAGEGTAYTATTLEKGFCHKMEHVLLHSMRPFFEQGEECKVVALASCGSDIASTFVPALATARARTMHMLQSASTSASGNNWPEHVSGTVMYMQGSAVATRGEAARYSALQSGKEHTSLYLSHMPVAEKNMHMFRVPLGDKYMSQVNRPLQNADKVLTDREVTALTDLEQKLAQWQEKGKPVTIISLEPITTRTHRGISVGMLIALHYLAKKHGVLVLHDLHYTTLRCSKLMHYQLFDDSVRKDITPGAVIMGKAMEIASLVLINPLQDPIFTTPYKHAGPHPQAHYLDVIHSLHGNVSCTALSTQVLKAAAILNFVHQHDILSRVGETGRIIHAELREIIADSGEPQDEVDFWVRGVGTMFRTNLKYDKELLAGNIYDDRFCLILNADVDTVKQWVRETFIPSISSANDELGVAGMSDRVHSDTYRREMGRQLYRRVVGMC